MNYFQQHIPNFAWDPRMDPPEKFYFKTTKELLELERVKQYTKWKEYHHFKMWDDMLMIFSKDEEFWWCVGRINKPEQIDLPFHTLKPKKKPTWLKKKWQQLKERLS